MAKSRVLLLWGGYYHDFQAAAGIIWNFLKPFDRYEVTATDDRKSLERLDPFDAVILYTQGGKPTPAEENGILNFVRRGGGLLGIHCASDTFRESERFIEMLGGRFTSHSPTHEFEVKASSTENFLNQRLRPFRITDELYVLEKFDPKKSTVAATTFWQGKDVPMAYTKGYGKGRVAYLGLGHQPSSFRNPGFQKLFLRALDWVTKNDRPKPKGLSVGIVGYGGAYCMGRHHIENMTKTGFSRRRLSAT